MEFVRSLATNPLDCSAGKREQVNVLTSWIDGSQIYGNNRREQEELRTETGGLLKSITVNNPSEQIDNDEFLPAQNALDGACVRPLINVIPNGPFCTLTGDERQNEQGGLTSMHTLWLREHNRIARKLAKINPSWSDEELFQVTRRIIGGMLQHITYKEDLPIVLGPKIIEQFSLGVSASGFFQGYNKLADPQMTASFSTAAYRFGHSLIRDQVVRRNASSRPSTLFPNVRLRNSFNNPTLLFRANGADSVLSGLVAPAQRFDNRLTSEITNRLFAPPGSPRQGLDLASLNINRGRDHGLPSYIRFRKARGLSADLTDIPYAVRQQLLTAYGDRIKDIELFPAGLSEKPIRDLNNNVVSVVGPLFGNIIGEQFKRLKFGDRFYYENPFESFAGGRRGFTIAELSQIRRTTLAGVICRNTDIERIPGNVFLLPSRTNPRRLCSRGIRNETSLDLSVFKRPSTY